MYTILRVTTLLENATFLSQSGLDHTNPGGIYQNARADMSGWASQFPSEDIAATGCIDSPFYGEEAKILNLFHRLPDQTGITHLVVRLV
ncbi:hypothetical protein Bca52824_004380 [Brassica carinata]|uniref:Uncharacterized protein n=1 Tax=Brassica carinata TaxID=52824 RepID=A0A8X7WQ04_BRACI|nr:hypothetical protein Bca52824_004380 [Brassica carinata]